MPMDFSASLVLLILQQYLVTENEMFLCQSVSLLTYRLLWSAAAAEVFTASFSFILISVFGSDSWRLLVYYYCFLSVLSHSTLK